MADSILILRWTGSAYDSFTGLLGLMAQELSSLGLRVVIFATEAQDWPRRLFELLRREQFIFALTMSGIGMELAVQGRGSIWRVTKVPLFNWSCDHPCYYPVRHSLRNRFLLHGYVFPDHAQYNIRHLNPAGTAFCVHIGMPTRRIFPSAPLPLSERNGRIIFSKSGRDSNAIAASWQNRLPLIRAVLLAAAEELFLRSTTDFVQVLQRIAEQYGLLLDGNSELTLNLIRELDGYIRFRRANMVMRALLDYPVDVFGNGWDHIRADTARATFHGSVPWQSAAVERLPRYLGCLSINPLVERSVHDRVFFAVAAGVTPISDSNEFARARMPALLPYSFEFLPERISAAVEALLANPAEALERAETTWQAFAPDLTMRRAAEQIVQFASLNALNTRCAP